MLAEAIKRQLSAGSGNPSWARGAVPRSPSRGPAKHTPPVSLAAASSYGATALRLVSRWRDLPAMFMSISDNVGIPMAAAIPSVSPPTRGHPITTARQCGGSFSKRLQDTSCTVWTRGETTVHLREAAAPSFSTTRVRPPLRGLASLSSTIAGAPPQASATCQSVRSPGSECSARSRHVSTDSTLTENNEHGIAPLPPLPYPGRRSFRPPPPPRSANRRRLFVSGASDVATVEGWPASPDARAALTGDPGPDLDPTTSSASFAPVPPSLSSPHHPSYPPATAETLPSTSGDPEHLPPPVGSLLQRDGRLEKAATPKEEDGLDEGDGIHDDSETSSPHEQVARAIEDEGTPRERGEEGICWIDYLALSDQELLRQCQVDTYRASGPGGQHRNKTESAVRLRHVSGVAANASERRSQYQNKEMAVQRLRQSIALNIRRTITVSDAYQPSPELLAIFPRGISSKAKNAPRVSYGPNHPRFWNGAQQLLDVFVAAGCSVSDTAKVLRMTSSMTAKLLTSEGTLLRRVNQLRAERGLKNLR